MKTDQIKAIQTKIGVEPDSFWGPKSIAAAQKYLRKLMPSPNPWPATDQASLTAFYGAAGDESQHTTIDVTGLGVKYDGKTVNKIKCHKKIADPLKRVLSAIAKDFPQIVGDYAGVYNNRAMRGGSTPSLHARAAAIDLSPGSNGNHVSWPVKATMPFEVMEAFAREGALAAGAFWGRDAMHFQFTR